MHHPSFQRRALFAIFFCRPVLGRSPWGCPSRQDLRAAGLFVREGEPHALYRSRATAPRRAICLRAYCPGIDGDFQRPACCISTTEAPAAAKDCAEPTRRLCPLTRPGTPAAFDRLAMIVRSERALSPAQTLPPLVSARNSAPDA